MPNGRHTKACSIDGRRCSKCRKIAKDLIDGEYLCRIHSPVREFIKTEIANEKLSKKKKK